MSPGLNSDSGTSMVARTSPSDASHQHRLLFCKLSSVCMCTHQLYCAPSMPPPMEAERIALVFKEIKAQGLKDIGNFLNIVLNSRDGIIQGKVLVPPYLD